MKVVLRKWAYCINQSCTPNHEQKMVRVRKYSDRVQMKPLYHPQVKRYVEREILDGLMRCSPHKFPSVEVGMKLLMLGRCRIAPFLLTE
jgi:hypothetical protein